MKGHTLTETTVQNTVLERLGATPKWYPPSRRFPSLRPAFWVLPDHTEVTDDRALAVWVLERMVEEGWNFASNGGPGAEPFIEFWRERPIAGGGAAARTFPDAIFAAAWWALGVKDD